MNAPTDDRKETLEALVRAHQARVHTYIFSKTGDLDAADELSQEVFLRAYQALGTFDRTREELPWLLGIARNLLRERWRNLARGRDSQRLRAAVLESRLDREGEASAERHESRLAALRGCVGKLPPPAQKLVRVLYEQRLNCEEVARLWRRDGHVLRNTIYRIRKELRQCVERNVAGGTA